MSGYTRFLYIPDEFGSEDFLKMIISDEFIEKLGRLNGRPTDEDIERHSWIVLKAFDSMKDGGVLFEDFYANNMGEFPREMVEMDEESGLGILLWEGLKKFAVLEIPTGQDLPYMVNVNAPKYRQRFSEIRASFGLNQC